MKLQYSRDQLRKMLWFFIGTSVAMTIALACAIYILLNKSSFAIAFLAPLLVPGLIITVWGILGSIYRLMSENPAIAITSAGISVNGIMYPKLIRWHQIHSIGAIEAKSYHGKLHAIEIMKTNGKPVQFPAIWLDHTPDQIAEWTELARASKVSANTH